MCKTLQSVTSVFTRRDISSTFVKHLGPVVFNVLRPIVIGNEDAAKVNKRICSSISCYRTTFPQFSCV
jgi:hypothetical protein